MKKLRFILLLRKNLFFLDVVNSRFLQRLMQSSEVFFVCSPERKLRLILAIPGLNPLGGLPSKSVQFGFPYRIVVAEPLRFIALIICCFFISNCNEKIENKTSKKKILVKISVEKFKGKLDTNKYILIDVKTKKEHEKENIPGSSVIDFYGNNFKSNLNSLDKNKKYLIYCHKGARSSLALRLMNMLEFKEVYELKGGISAWKSAGFKVVKGES